MITQLVFKTLIIVGLFVIAIFVHKIGMIISAFVFKLRIKEIYIFSGKSILNQKLKDFTISIGFIPFGGYIKYYD
jgi:Peptidase family M50